MISSRWLARFLGDMGFTMDSPQLVVTQDFQQMRMPVRTVYAQAGVPSNAYLNHLHVDPPVGAFALGDLLQVLPRDVASLPVAAPVAAPDPAYYFSPGVFCITLRMASATLFSQVDLVAFRVFPRGTSEFAVLPGQGAANSVMVYLRGQGANILGPQIQFYITSPVPWMASVSAGTVLSDTDLFNLAIVIEPRALLDEAGNLAG